ncbi:S8 family serine peptidase [Nucisporomicrobium flavum]|uniref:S8 family serine peptidase n=1 Tax=Nucisporomicrobium flavum TaxID=2785915 RepID=UPI003C2CCB4E
MLSAALAVSGGAAAGLVVSDPAQAAGAQAAGTLTEPAPKPKKGWLLDSSLTTMKQVNDVIGAPAVWGKKDSVGRNLTGQGVGVALIDSGIAPVKGLNQPGKVINGPDLSLESQAANLRNQDTFGHGTHMAGIISGRDPEAPAGKEADPRYFVGVAPDARLVNLRVAAADGAVDVSQIIAAVDWAVTHRNDPGLNIRVINLSFGTDSLQDPRLDPLSYAVETAWRAGIVVVVSVGNDGPTQTRVGNPALNPYVIAVGGSDIAGTLARGDDTIGTFSTRGDLTRHADVVAPGRSIGSLRDPGSYIDENYPTGQVADATGRYFKGSGTSQAAAVVSGAVALLLQQRPTLTPDQVKKLLTSTAVPMKNVDAIAQGAGEINVQAASTASTPATAGQSFPRALGTGTLEGARGTAHLADSESGIELTGERDIMNRPWNPAPWTAAAAAGRAWTGGSWNGNTWTGAAWNGTSWATKTWAATSWTARTWSGSTWTARTWSSAGWSGAGWTARTWSARTWSARTWSGGYWASRTWQ